MSEGHFKFENEDEWTIFEECRKKDEEELVKVLENLTKGVAENKGKAEQILTTLKNILGDDLTDWETKIAKKSEVDQANNSLTQLENEKVQLKQQITNFINQLNDLNNGNKNKEELEQKIKQLTTELEQVQNNESPRTSEPSDYQDIKTELEQLRKQAVNSQDKELVKKIAELTDKINQRERERETNLPSEQRLYWIIGGGSGYNNSFSAYCWRGV
ncbi:MAG: hypothetical protein MRERV_19c011 [Mycoplasmataceae bacterium RV_VA103A]|nr:MAG: hypothetical protein MRERV_19c011 [Mycoplasmataceae bacterium RV_VA103A]